MTTLDISDLHAPYNHPDAIDFLSDLRKEYKPDEVVCLGDEADLHRFSAHEIETESLDARREIRGVRRFISDLAKLFPTLKLCTSNHVARLLKAANRANLPRSVIRRWSSIIGAPSTWQWRDAWEIGGVTHFHGDGYGGIKSRFDALLDFGTNVAFGHLHSIAGVEWVTRAGFTRWGMCCGALCSPRSVAMRYAKHSRAKTVLGTGVIVDGVPIFEPMKY